MKLSKVTGMPPVRVFKPNKQLVLSDCHIGIEIEVEGRGAIHNSVMDSLYWQSIEDHSLRNNGRELVLRQPTMGDGLIEALDELDNIVDSGRVDYSSRTSVHVHVDVRDMSVEQLFTLLFFYIYIEKALFNYVDEGREDSNYCIPWWKTEQLKGSLYNIYKAMTEDNPTSIRDEIASHMTKYSALNLLAINRFGSVEFRHHYGTHDKHRLLEWINILMSLKEQALKIDHSHVSFEELLNQHFEIPKELDLFMTEPVTYKGMSFLNEIYHDCRLHTKQAIERKLLSNSFKKNNIKHANLKMFDAFNTHRDLSMLRSRRNTNSDEESLEEDEVTLLVGGSSITYDDVDDEDIPILVNNVSTRRLSFNTDEAATGLWGR
jgi:hypothetical protein